MSLIDEYLRRHFPSRPPPRPPPEKWNYLPLVCLPADFSIPYFNFTVNYKLMLSKVILAFALALVTALSTNSIDGCMSDCVQHPPPPHRLEMLTFVDVLVAGARPLVIFRPARASGNPLCPDLGACVHADLNSQGDREGPWGRPAGGAGEAKALGWTQGCSPLTFVLREHRHLLPFLLPGV